MPPFLIVEDNIDSADMMARILRFYNLPHEIVTTAEAALEQVTQRPYSGLIIDLALPAMDGWTLLRHVQSLPEVQHLACVAVTAYHSNDLFAKAAAAGFAAYFPKPLEKAAFAAELQRLVG